MIAQSKVQTSLVASYKNIMLGTVCSALLAGGTVLPAHSFPVAGLDLKQTIQKADRYIYNVNMTAAERARLRDRAKNGGSSSTWSPGSRPSNVDRDNGGFGGDAQGNRGQNQRPGDDGYGAVPSQADRGNGTVNDGGYGAVPSGGGYGSIPSGNGYDAPSNNQGGFQTGNDGRPAVNNPYDTVPQIGPTGNGGYAIAPPPANGGNPYGVAPPPAQNAGSGYDLLPPPAGNDGGSYGNVPSPLNPYGVAPPPAQNAASGYDLLPPPAGNDGGSYGNVPSPLNPYGAAPPERVNNNAYDLAPAPALPANYGLGPQQNAQNPYGVLPLAPPVPPRPAQLGQGDNYQALPANAQNGNPLPPPLNLPDNGQNARPIDTATLPPPPVPPRPAQLGLGDNYQALPANAQNGNPLPPPLNLPDNGQNVRPIDTATLPPPPVPPRPAQFGQDGSYQPLPDNPQIGQADYGQPALTPQNANGAPLPLPITGLNGQGDPYQALPAGAQIAGQPAVPPGVRPVYGQQPQYQRPLLQNDPNYQDARLNAGNPYQPVDTGAPQYRQPGIEIGQYGQNPYQTLPLNPNAAQPNVPPGVTPVYGQQPQYQRPLLQNDPNYQDARLNAGDPYQPVDTGAPQYRQPGIEIGQYGQNPYQTLPLNPNAAQPNVPPGVTPVYGQQPQYQRPLLQNDPNYQDAQLNAGNPYQPVDTGAPQYRQPGIEIGQYGANPYGALNLLPAPLQDGQYDRVQGFDLRDRNDAGNGLNGYENVDAALPLGQSSYEPVPVRVNGLNGNPLPPPLNLPAAGQALGQPIDPAQLPPPPPALVQN